MELVEPETDPLVLPVPVTVPELAPVLSRSRSRGAFASVEVECRDVSDALRPLARRRDFIEPCWLQSHLQSLSLPIVSVDAVSRLELLPTEAVSRLEVPVELVSWLGAVADDPMPVVADDDVLPVEGVVALLLFPVVEVSFPVVLVLGVAVLLVLLLGFERSVPVCAITAGAARARARTAVGASFIGILR